MKLLALALMLGAFSAAPALAQQAPGDGPPPDVQQQMQTARDAARSQALAAITPDHQAKINDVVARVKSGQITDARDAASQIDAVLTPKESQAVLAARDKMFASMHRPEGGPGGPGGPGGGGDNGGPGASNGGPPGGGPPGGGPPRNGSGRGMRNDAGFALLSLSLDRQQMRALMGNSHPAQ